MRKLSLLSFISQVAGFSFYFLTTFILIRLVGKNEFGIFQKFNLFLTTALPFFGFTLVSSLYYFHSIYKSQLEKSNLFNQTFFLLSLSGVLFSILFFLNKEDLMWYLNLEELGALPDLIFLTILFYINSSICDNIFLLDNNKLGVLVFIPFEKFLFLAVILISFFFKNDFNDVFYGFLIFSFLKFLFTFYYLIRNHGLLKFRINLNSIKKQAYYCIPFYLGNIIYIVSIKFDKFLLNQFISPNEYAIYTVSFLSIPFLANAYSSVNNVVLPEFTALIQERKYEKIKELYQNVVLKTGSVAIPLLFFFFCFSKYFIELIFTSSYLEGDLYYRIGLFSFLALLTSYGLVLRAAHKTKTIFMINLISAIISVVLGYVIIPKFLLLGAAITSVIAVFLPGLLQLIFEIRYLKFNFFNFFPVNNFLIVIALSFLIFPIYFLGVNILPDNHALTIITGMVYFPIVFSILFKLGFLPYRDVFQKLLKK
ncbi:oligosaccharide flippase family protein [Aquiflexum sp. LQ15W]|uniref:oligosaccharide flippase family protein n=1 Tax=Cognataquiflexum nitidum TaxID=2922272 RepID=UPI001F136731|nr:oligosaccharide flippase family protein [Cognataquiflexum nitidum]MCH6199261.1 oligosaccharide flippase family protein [Cognataquiflexum nitidum]